MLPRSCITKVYLIVGCLLAGLPFALAAIQCKQPSTGIFKAGDPVTLDWTSDGRTPTVADIISMSGALYCDSGVKITDITITDWRNPFPWTVPSVGNATIPGGTVGMICPGNAFHVQYSGRYEGIFTDPNFGPVPCPSITILPNPGVVPTTTTSLTPTTTTTTRTTKTSSTASPTETDKSEEKSEETNSSSSIIVIVGIVAGLVLFLVLFGTWWSLRKKKLERMENAIMPWSTQSNNQFSKVSSMDDGNRNTGSNFGSQPAAPVAPVAPAATHGRRQDDGYNYGRHGAAGGGGGGYGYGGNHQGYDGYNTNNNQDDYYNPHYAQKIHHGTGQSYANNHTSTSPPYYNSNTPYQDPNDSFQQKGQQQPGYFPPPPPGSSHPKSVSASPSSNSLALTNHSTSKLTTSPSSRRAPQTFVLPEKGSPSDDNTQQIPMKDLAST
ncbi:hypothetical protein BGZ65_002724 [Modicella reniformis]|uniref:Uncharacterized protein n=1 Tax=Modicella reniformis TaxID=1440133 RepID=A0A9P6J0U5_9FUNG|nr:hypothetical protein BGZ65_002724 [Modicella reniformis]